MQFKSSGCLLKGIDFKNCYNPSRCNYFITAGLYSSNTVNFTIDDGTFENITTRPAGVLLRYVVAGDECVLSNCNFYNNTASLIVNIQPKDDYGMYPFLAYNNRFIDNHGTMEEGNNANSVGLCFKINGREQSTGIANAKFINNTFIRNTHAIHGAAYCILGHDITIIGNYLEANSAVFTNTGETELTSIFVEENIPKGLAYDHFTGSNWTKNGNRFHYNGSLDIGESAVFNIIMNVTGKGKLTNTVVAGSNESENATDNATISVNNPQTPAPKLDVVKVADKKTVKVGDLVTFTITVSNIGDCALGEIFIKENIPSGLEYIRHSSNWNRNNNVFTYSGNLNPNESLKLEIVFRALKQGNITNIVVAGSNMTGNLTANASVIVEIEENKPADDPKEEKQKSYSEKSEDLKTHNPQRLKQTGNPIALLLLMILIVIPLRRREN